MKTALGLLVVSTLIAPVALPRAVRGLSAWHLDGLDGLWCGLLVGEDTIYSPDYSARAFGEVEVGMTRTEVYALLGEPLSSFEGNNFDYEVWSHSPGDTHFRRRTLAYSDELVTEIIGEFYYD